jgi:hypothetical protein
MLYAHFNMGRHYNCRNFTPSESQAFLHTYACFDEISLSGNDWFSSYRYLWILSLCFCKTICTLKESKTFKICNCQIIYFIKVNKYGCTMLQFFENAFKNIVVVLVHKNWNNIIEWEWSNLRFYNPKRKATCLLHLNIK